MNSDLIFYFMFHDPDYFAKVFSTVTEHDFSTLEDKTIMKGFDVIHGKHKKIASVEEMKLYVNSLSGAKPEICKNVSERLDKYVNTTHPMVDKNILIEATEKYVKNVRLEQLIERGILMLEGKNQKDTHDTLLEDMKSKIVELSFQTSLGHDYFKDAELRFQEYGKLDSYLVSSGIHLLDLAGAGKPKTITVLLATSNVGKSLHMASWAAVASMAGSDVAIFSMEDGEIAYGSRLDANLMNTTLESMKASGMALMTTFKSTMHANMGQIKIKEFPTGGANANHIRATLMDWKVKDNFVPKIIFVDYINIMASCRKVGGNGYENGKLVTEELRGLAVEYNVPLVTATQGRRDVFASQALSMADVAESIGIPQTADVMIGIVSGGDEQPDKQFLSVLKSRQINKSKLKPCAVNVSTEHQRVWDVDDKRRFKPSAEVKQTFAGMDTFVATSELLDSVPEAKLEKMPASVPVGRNADLSEMFKGL